MRLIALLLISAAVLTEAYNRLAGYSPASLVTDYNALDLDLKAINDNVEYKDPPDYDRAYKIYTQGGNSKSTSTLVLAESVAGIDNGDKVSQTVGDAGSGNLQVITGTVWNSQLKSGAGDRKEIRVTYTVATEQESSHADCRVGGLETKDHITTGCFLTTEMVTVGATSYTITSMDHTLAGRTLQSFSTRAKEMMRNCNSGCPYPTFLKFADFYGVDDYADNFVKAAMGTPANNFKPGKIGWVKHDMDFSGIDKVARKELIPKGIALMGVWMYVVRMIESAINQCTPNCIACNDNAVKTWDGAVAFFVGSLEGQQGNVEKGMFPHQMGDKRCENFKTCGPTGGSTSGTSMVNTKLMRLFAEGQSSLLMGNCKGATALLDPIVSQMAIPQIQGTIRYAEICARTSTPSSKARAEGTAFASAVVPLIAACPGTGKADAETIWKQMEHGHGKPYDYLAVKTAFERNYGCLNITCAEVGGFYNSEDEVYYGNSEPCTDVVPGTPMPVGAIVALVAVGVIAFLCACCAFYMFRNERKGTPVFTSLNPQGAPKSYEMRSQGGGASGAAA